jgi:hypothetical protein
MGVFSKRSETVQVLLSGVLILISGLVVDGYYEDIKRAWQCSMLQIWGKEGA